MTDRKEDDGELLVTNTVFSDFLAPCDSPPPFHGFGIEDTVPGRMKIETEMDGLTEVLLRVNKQKRIGRPRVQ